MIKTRVMRWVGHATRKGYKRNAYRVLVGMPEGKRPLERSRCRWEDNIKMNIEEILWGDTDWIIWLRIETS
jgi:hypothetical protein